MKSSSAAKLSGRSTRVDAFCMESACVVNKNLQESIGRLGL